MNPYTQICVPEGTISVVVFSILDKFLLMLGASDIMNVPNTPVGFREQEKLLNDFLVLAVDVPSPTTRGWD